MNIKFHCHDAGKQNAVHMQGRLFGTTFSGHPTATTMFGTLRNVLYVMFAVWRKNKMNIKTFLISFRKKFRLFCSGDDGACCCRTRTEASELKACLE